MPLTKFTYREYLASSCCGVMSFRQYLLRRMFAAGVITFEQLMSEVAA